MKKALKKLPAKADVRGNDGQSWLYSDIVKEHFFNPKNFMRYEEEKKFKELDETYAEILNKFIETKDVDGARWYAEHYLGI